MNEEKQTSVISHTSTSCKLEECCLVMLHPHKLKLETRNMDKHLVDMPVFRDRTLAKKTVRRGNYWPAIRARKVVWIVGKREKTLIKQFRSFGHAFTWVTAKKSNTAKPTKSTSNVLWRLASRVDNPYCESQKHRNTENFIPEYMKDHNVNLKERYEDITYGFSSCEV